MERIKSDLIYELKFLLKTYDALNTAIVQTKNRLTAFGKDNKFEDILNGGRKHWGLEQIKLSVSRQIGHTIESFPLWSEWLKGIPGIGSYIGGNLIVLYYYRFVAICKKCGGDLLDFECIVCNEKSKGGGVLEFRIEERDYETISKFWKFMGQGVDAETGKMDKRAKGKASNWSHIGRQMMYLTSESFNKFGETHKYKELYLREKARLEKRSPELTKIHRHNMAWMKTRKIFLAHMWTVARTIDGKTVSKPYAGSIMGHDNIIDPFYFDSQDRN